MADVSVIGRPAIFVPLAQAIRDEQTANARAMVEANAAVLMPESQMTPQTLADTIERILGNPEAASMMAAAALSCGKPDATERLVALVEELAQRPEH